MGSDKCRHDYVEMEQKAGEKKRTGGRGVWGGEWGWKSVQSWHDSSNILSLTSLFIAAHLKSRNASGIVATCCAPAPTAVLNETESCNYCTHTLPPQHSSSLNCLPWDRSSMLVLLLAHPPPPHPLISDIFLWHSANTSSTLRLTPALICSAVMYYSSLLNAFSQWFANSISILKFTHIIQNVRFYVSPQSLWGEYIFFFFCRTWQYKFNGTDKWILCFVNINMWKILK